MNKINSDEKLLADLGLEPESEMPTGISSKESRIISGFEEIERFFEKHGRKPEHGEGKDIFERVYAVRFDSIQKSEECRAVLFGKDKYNLLAGADFEVNEDLDDEDLLSELGVTVEAADDITKLKYVKTRAEKRASEEFARRTPCVNFEKFKSLFEKVQAEISQGQLQTIPYKYGSKINAGDLYILGGQKAYVAVVGDEIIDEDDKTDRRLRVIFDNGTESNLLLRSLQRALIKDITSRRITNNTMSEPLFTGVLEASDTATGTIYVLRSRSENPIVLKSREVIHKIGVTSNSVEKRIANAELDPTFLMADVEVVATYELANISKIKLEGLIHKFFEPARLDIEIKDRFGLPVIPREWFLVPLFIINEAVERIKDGSIINCRYDVKSGKIVEV